ncbi:hypothetical protein GGR42_001855 [Saonia flava]|uniref:HmuY protein n=1 Tax=Saonia flava TaxID=523696 RepID=A0A846QYW2_9FLAO|nr:HmuY family protein [Saonia flava]NJB71393.1 hypothetical protein [Saonia flava]
MKNPIPYLLIFTLLFIGVSCSSDDETVPETLVVAFENPSLSFDTVDTQKEITLVFSATTLESGTVTINYTTENATYGDTEDFTTSPSGASGSIVVDIAESTNSTSFTFNKLKDAIEGTTKLVTFSIASISIPDAISNGNTQLQISFAETAATAGSFAPEVGGPNEPNQVYVDLSSLTQSSANRASWDLGFHSGDEYRVTLNGSIFMAAAKLEATDIDAVTPEDVAELQPQVAVGTFDAANTAYVDGVTGEITTTAIAEISETDEDNTVYLLNLGFEVGTDTPDIGSVDISDDPRGWKKIRILRSGTDYVLQYADLDASEHTEVTVSKNTGYHFSHFSFDTEKIVSVQPASDKWDMNFTVFTNEIPGFGSYGYSDFIATNSLSGVGAYQVEAATIAYADFTLSSVEEASFVTEARAIGSGWRNGGGPGTLPSIKDDIYYVLKDADGNIYKIRFTALVNESGERGYPEFEFELL